MLFNEADSEEKHSDKKRKEEKKNNSGILMKLILPDFYFWNGHFLML